MKKETIGMFGGKFLIVHKGHVHAMRKAAAMVDKLYVIVTYNVIFEREVYFHKSKIAPIAVEQRMRWWHEITKELDNVHVYAIEETNINKNADTHTNVYSYAHANVEPDWESCADSIKTLIGKPIDFIFSSEPRYSDYFDDLYPKAKHIIIDADRQLYPISASQLRHDGVIQHWDRLPDVVQPYFAKSVVIVGTESTGKTTLAKDLAHRYNTCYVEEAGRKFYEQINAEIVLLEDFAQIAYEHKYHERQAKKAANKIYFVDTEAITTQFFSMAYLDVRQSVLDETAKLQDYDLWLFLEADIEWVADGLRSFSDTQVRDKNNQLLKSLLNEFGVRYHIISGNYDERYKESLKYVDKLLTQ
ncbi:multifunctional transcriptional regulator/nicotinamide-nucleotide adenylyltransferase/ribosylnicotinamide kinase NadR [Psychrobacter immobilis]|uniref:multifunctional transcriptional regulator/nicotinamide-nucleotide adenylyltransferase/ribosylnicotinamide kinase NadR n=1 Tax=Psychrobacter immobilis TaxID=498 RepID=UPI001917E97F|nr:multifunctional transcriptional regulator/nicotinamide-nucleotide adenylyltransferase/ribosylnicotinamide kinase NadR [Psychrobacter immobilis]